jgi:hypothetical protein
MLRNSSVVLWGPFGASLVANTAVLFQFAAPAAAQIKQGTYFIAGFSRDYAVIAIDSRELEASVINDKDCKIEPLSPNAFFFMRGVTAAIDITTLTRVFDARRIAHSAYNDTGDKRDFSSMAEKWANSAINIYSNKPAEFGRSAVDGIMNDIFFVGTGGDGTIQFAAQTILYRPNELPLYRHFSQAIVFDDDLADVPATYAAGYLDLIREFSDGGKTERAKKFVARLGALAPGPNSVAARYTAYIEAIEEWSGDKAIGGETSVVILERGKKWRWYHRPDFCPKN